MSTGLFSNRAHNLGSTIYFAQLRKSGAPQDRAKLDAFAEALAETGTVTAAAARCRISRQRGSQFLARLRAELGWQAQ